MLTPIQVEPGIIVDGRVVVVALASVFEGTGAGLITTALVMAFRSWLGGVGTIPGQGAILTAFLLGALLHRRWEVRLGGFGPKQFLLLGAGLAVSGLLWTLMLADPLLARSTFQTLALPVGLVYPLETLLLGTLISHQIGRQEAEDAVTRAREELEQHVADRTTELSKSNGLLRDEIAERRRAEEGLVQRTQQLDAIRVVTAEITSELNLTTLLDLILRRALELVGAASGTIYLWDEADQVLVPQTWQSPYRWLSELRLRLGEGVAGTVAQRCCGMIVNDFRTSPYATPFLLERTTHTAILAEPLLYHGRLLGVVAINNVETGRPFTDQDQSVMALFASQVAIAIENARLHASTQRWAEKLATLNELARRLTTTLEPEQVAREILTAVQVLLPGAAGRLWELKDKGVLHLVGSVGLRQPEGARRDRFPMGEGLTGIAAATRQPVTSFDVTQDPRFANQPWAAAEGLMSCIVLPLVRGDAVTGSLGIYIRDPHEFTEEEVNLLCSFAAQAAIALENARFFEQVREGRERLQSLSRQLVEVQEGERRNIARELHDEIGQLLTGLKLLLEMGARVRPEKVNARLSEAQALVNELVTRVRELSLDLRPAMLDDLGILPALLWHFERFTELSKVRVVFGHSGLEGQRFSPEVETAAYRIVQEALTNVARHAKVAEVAVRLWADENTLDLRIEDRGAGFDPEATLSAAASSGLAGMRERAALLGGRLTVTSTPGSGTQVMAELPLTGRFEKRRKPR
jgi:signal transduction histidine kinase